MLGRSSVHVGTLARTRMILTDRKNTTHTQPLHVEQHMKSDSVRRAVIPTTRRRTLASATLLLCPLHVELYLHAQRHSDLICRGAVGGAEVNLSLLC
jgi:hypothetical protein